MVQHGVKFVLKDGTVDILFFASREAVDEFLSEAMLTGFIVNHEHVQRVVKVN